jgi:hypothetical protein
MAKRKADNFIASDDEDDGDFDETGQSAQSEQDEKPKSPSRKVCPLALTRTFLILCRQPTTQKSRTTVKNESNDDEVEASLKKKPKSAKVLFLTTAPKILTNRLAPLKEPKIESESPDGADIAIHSTPEGDKYLDLGKKKRATVRTFKGSYLQLWSTSCPPNDIRSYEGNMLLDIREFYGTDGDEKPGKKGISLSIEQASPPTHLHLKNRH